MVLSSCVQPSPFRWIVKGVPAFSLSADKPLPATLRLTKYGTCAITLPFCMSWITCQPPSPSGTWICEFSDPSAAELGLPSGIETKLQHVPEQLTRLPTTVDHTRSTSALGFSP